MTEKEKMISHLTYDPNHDRELLGSMMHSVDVCMEYNSLNSTQIERRTEIMKNFLGKTNGKFYLAPPFWCDYGYRIELGENFFANYNCVMLDAGGITFGDNVLVGPNCGFYTAGHPIDFPRRNQGLEYAYPIKVGNNVWIGGGVHVMPGVTIGDNVVIGGGSVVTHDIPDNVVAAGNPCRVIRPITDEDYTRSYDWNADKSK